MKNNEPHLHCPKCNLLWTPARCDEEYTQENGRKSFRPGPYIRCVECKSTYYRPKTNLDDFAKFLYDNSPLSHRYDWRDLNKEVKQFFLEEAEWFVINKPYDEWPSEYNPFKEGA